MHPALSSLLILLVSLVVLAISSEWVVRSGVRLARLLRISELAVGFILISVLTSLPELMVSVNSSTAEKIGLSVGNIVGSNIVDIALVLGLGFYLYPKVVKGAGVLRKLSAALLLTSATLIIFLLFPSLSRLTGFALLGLFLFFCYYLIRGRLRIHEAETVHQKTGLASKISRLHLEERALFAGGGLGRKERDTALSLLHLIGGTVLVVMSSGAVVNSGVGLAESLGIAKSVVGAVIVAFGTSVPELSVELTALRRGRIGLALGDAIGSTVTNLTLVLGTSLVIFPGNLNVSFFSTLILFSLLTNVVFWYFLSGRTFGKREGAVLLAIYASFLLVLLGEQAVAAKDSLLAFVGGLLR